MLAEINNTWTPFRIKILGRLLFLLSLSFVFYHLGTITGSPIVAIRADHTETNGLKFEFLNSTAGTKTAETKLKQQPPKLDKQVVNSSIKFYLESLILEYNTTSVYSREIYDFLENHPQRTLDVSEATVSFTLFNNENNYPNFDSKGMDRKGKDIANFDKACDFVKDRPLPNDSQIPRIIMFCNAEPGTPKRQAYCPSLRNIPYENMNFNPLTDIIAIPPSLKTHTAINYNALSRANAKYLVTFKATTTRNTKFYYGNIRKTVFDLLAPYDNDKDIIIRDKTKSPQNKTARDYVDLLENTIFGLNVDGDLPWCYRFIEILKSGSIPVFVASAWRNLPYSQLIDWDKAVVRIEIGDMGKTIDILRSISDEEIARRQAYIRDIILPRVETREQQMSTTLEILTLQEKWKRKMEKHLL
eukprot:Awhi_evm1s4239